MEYLFGFSPAGEALKNWSAVNLFRWGVPILSAGMGVAGAAIGSVGVLAAGNKSRWLENRLMTERLRHFHFQSFIAGLPDIVLSLADAEGVSKFRTERSLWLDAFKGRYIGNLQSELTEVLSEGDTKDFWLFNNIPENVTAIDKSVGPLFEAYRELRLVHQINHAKYKLREDGAAFLTDAPRRQAELLANVGYVFVILVAVVHIIVMGWAVVSRNTLDGVPSIAANVAITLIAFGALALRALEQGLQPEREVERYQQYKSSLAALLSRFDRCSTLVEKYVVMKDMERLAFDEMRNFLLTNMRTKFVM